MNKIVRVYIASSVTVEVDVGPGCTDDEAIKSAVGIMSDPENEYFVAESLFDSLELVGSYVLDPAQIKNVVKMSIVKKD